MIRWEVTITTAKGRETTRHMVASPDVEAAEKTARDTFGCKRTDTLELYPLGELPDPEDQRVLSAEEALQAIDAEDELDALAAAAREQEQAEAADRAKQRAAHHAAERKLRRAEEKRGAVYAEPIAGVDDDEGEADGAEG